MAFLPFGNVFDVARLIPDAIRKPLLWRPEDMPDMFGKVAIVTGGNSGIGFQVVKHLAEKQATVVMAVRNMGAGVKALRDIKRDVPYAKVEILFCDLASFSSIHQFVQDFLARHHRLHILVNCAGTFAPPPRMTEDGFMYTLGVNYFGPWYLTHLLVPVLTSSAPSRIVNVCSATEALGSIDWNDLSGAKLKENDFPVYWRAKLMLSMFTMHLSAVLRGTGVDVFASHPGFTATNTFRKGDMRYFSPHFFHWAEEYFAQHSYYGALGTLYCASEKGLQGRTGQYRGPVYWLNTLNTWPCTFKNPAVQSARGRLQLYDATAKIVEEACGRRMS